MENVLEIKKEAKIKFNIWYATVYFIFYSFCGFLLETFFGLYTKGVIESRQSFLFGPFCIIYGIGATLMITFLSSLKNKPIALFFGSTLLGATSEYTMSYLCEKIFHFKWWHKWKNLSLLCRYVGNFGNFINKIYKSCSR